MRHYTLFLAAVLLGYLAGAWRVIAQAFMLGFRYAQCRRYGHVLPVPCGPGGDPAVRLRDAEGTEWTFLGLEGARGQCQRCYRWLLDSGEWVTFQEWARRRSSVAAPLSDR